MRLFDNSECGEQKLKTESPDTICARLTARSTSALAAIGIAGPKAIAFADEFFRSARGVRLAEARIDRPYFGRFGRDVVDEVVLHVVSKAPTQEVIVYCHGGVALVDALLGELASHGAVSAGWREYCRHRGDSAIAIECREALAKTQSLAAANVLLDQLSGTLERGFDEAFAGNAETLDAMLSRSNFGLHLAQPWRVLLFGPPNVGKSSILNALVGYDRAIVEPIPGTTRDVLEGLAILGGWAVELLDGAGLRDTDDPVEAAGQALLIEAARSVDLRIQIVDTHAPYVDVDPVLNPDLVIGNKSDLPTDWTPANLAKLQHRCSAATGDGIKTLATLIANRLVPELPAVGDPVPFAHRQIALLKSLRMPVE